MRTEYRLFSDHSGFLSNIFTCDDAWQRPNNFLLVEILYFLAVSRKLKGEIGLEGYFTCRHVADELQKQGYDPQDVLAGLNVLLKSELIAADHMNTSGVNFDDSVRILASGFIHVRVLAARIEYLYNVIPTTPVFDPDVARVLATFVEQEIRMGRTDAARTIRAVETFYGYLRRHWQENIAPFAKRRTTGAEYILNQIGEAITHFKNASSAGPSAPDPLDL